MLSHGIKSSEIPQICTLLWACMSIVKNRIETWYFKRTFKKKFYRCNDESKCKHILFFVNFGILHVTSTLRALCEQAREVSRKRTPPPPRPPKSILGKYGPRGPKIFFPIFRIFFLNFFFLIFWPLLGHFLVQQKFLITPFLAPGQFTTENRAIFGPN